VKKVILNHIGESVSSEDDEGPFPMALQLLLQACPHDVECSVLIFEKRKSQYNTNTTSLPSIEWEQSLFRQVGVGAWDRSEPDKYRKTILMPPKQFKGPAGGFGKLLYEQYTKIPLQRYGLFPLVVEALDRYHFDMGRNDPFSCPLPSCEAHFDKAGQWTVHVAEVHFREWSSLRETLPGSAGADLRKRSQALDSRIWDIEGEIIKLRKAWVVDNGVNQREMQRSWMEQLDSDPAWESKEKQERSRPWLELMTYLQLY
jgi:hypothetical protein